MIRNNRRGLNDEFLKHLWTRLRVKKNLKEKKAHGLAGKTAWACSSYP